MEMNENMTVETVEETQVPETEYVELVEVPVGDEELTGEVLDGPEDNGGGKLAIALGGLAIAGIGIAGYKLGKKVIKLLKKSKEDGEDEAEEATAKPVKGQKVRAIRGRKLTFVERITGHEYMPVDDTPEIREYED